MNEQFFIYNDKFYVNETPVISPGNRGLRYGDGFFETMKCINKKILNEDFHFERFFSSLSLLKFDIPKRFNKDFVLKKILSLCAKNGNDKIVRIRLMIFRGNGGIFDPENLYPNYIIETWEIENENKLNENGLVIDVLPGVRKASDIFSPVKSNNYLPYVMAGLYAKKHKLNDALVLNSLERICDSAIANIFIVVGQNIYTPPLSEGCVAGVMRRWMLEKFTLKDFRVSEKTISIDDLLRADECFLTNSIYHIRWVKNFRDKNYKNINTKKIYKHILETIQ